MPTALGDKVRMLRKKKGLTLEQLGNLTGSSKSYIWELENKAPPRPSAEKIQRIAAALGVTVEFLVDTESGEAPSDDVLDRAFFRKFQKMEPETKEKIRQMIDLWSKGD